MSLLKKKVGDGRYVLRRKVGSGAFGDIFEAETKRKRKVAVKVERVNCTHPQLAREEKIYKLLKGGTGVPAVMWFGQAHRCNMLVMDLLGSSLEDLFTACGRRFSLKTVLMLADQMMARVEFLHSKNYLHRDIKPDNFVIGRDNKWKVVYLIDFGLSKRYRHHGTHQHIPHVTGKNLTGTARYASLNTHLGHEQSRRDDLESIGYVLLYFLRGALPWQGLRAKTRQKHYNLICQHKQSYTPEILCEGLPHEFLLYFHHVRNLRFDEQPDYAFLRRNFRDLFYRCGYKPDFGYDWVTLGTPTP